MTALQVVLQILQVVLQFAVLPITLSSKLLPAMEVEETTKREQLLSGIANLPVPTQIEKIKVSNSV